MRVGLRVLSLLILFELLVLCSAENYYETLGLKQGTDQNLVKKQFRKLSLKYHPDKNRSPKAEEYYKKITHAYQQIMDGKYDDTPQQNNQDGYRYYSNGNNRGYTYYEYSDGQNRRSYTFHSNQSSNYIGNSQLNNLFLLLIFGVICVITWNTIFRWNSEMNTGEQKQDNQGKERTYYKSTQASQNTQSYQKNDELNRHEIKERNSNISSYSESNHRFQFYTNFGQEEK